MVVTARKAPEHNDGMGYLTVEQVAKRLLTGPAAIRRKIRDGNLPAVNIGSVQRPQWRIDEDDLARWEAERRSQPTGES